MKLTEANDQLMQLLYETWEAESHMRLDAARPQEALEYLLNEDPTSQWYMVGPTILILTGINGLNGNLMALNLTHAKRPSLRAELRAMMEEYGLRRLSTIVPASQKGLRDSWKTFGLRVEGRARDAGIMDGHFVDVWFMGIRHPEIAYGDENRGPSPPNPGGGKRKRRRRRGKKIGAPEKASVDQAS